VLLAIVADMTSSKVKFTTLITVYPPMSNQEAVWLQDDPDVVAKLRESDFYMIAARAEAKFLNLTCDPDAHTVDFLFQVGGGPSAPVHLDLRAMPGVAALGDAPIAVELGDKVVRVWDGLVRGAGSNVVAWFTTEKLLWDASRGHPGITGLDNLRELATYDLLYVGIATKTDSFARLFERGHKARQDILANEPQRYPGARVSDETYLFLFRCAPMVVQTFEPDHDFNVSLRRGPSGFEPPAAVRSSLRRPLRCADGWRGGDHHRAGASAVLEPAGQDADRRREQ
jgi:hypothetical protein